MPSIFDKKQITVIADRFEANINAVQSGYSRIESTNFIPLQGAINEAKRSFDADEGLYTEEDIAAMVERYQSVVSTLKSSLNSFVEFESDGTVVV